MDLYLGLVDISVPWPALVGIGLLVGILQGFFGIGGGWLATPSLNILGFPIVYAIGTDLAYTCVTGVIGSWRHHRLGNLAVRPATILGISGVVGIEVSRRLVFFLEGQGLADTAVRAAYVALLLGVGSGILTAYARSVRQIEDRGEEEPGGLPGTVVLRRIKTAPMVGLPGGGALVSMWVLVGTGMVVGALAGFLGTGGGFIMVPLLIYGVGLSARFAVAASLLFIAIANGYGSLAYGLAGKVEPAAVALMLSGSVVGTQVGATATVYVRGRRLQLLLGVLLVGAAIAVALRQIDLFVASAVVMFTTAAGMSALILALLIRARRRLAREEPSGPA